MWSRVVNTWFSSLGVGWSTSSNSVVSLPRVYVSIDVILCQLERNDLAGADMAALLSQHFWRHLVNDRTAPLSPHSRPCRPLTGNRLPSPLQIRHFRNFGCFNLPKQGFAWKYGIQNNDPWICLINWRICNWNLYKIIHHNWPTVYSETTRCVFCNTATGGQAPVVGFCNTPTGGLKVRLKRVKMPGYTGILSPRTYPSSSLPLQLADSFFKPTLATFLSIYFNIQANNITVIINNQNTLEPVGWFDIASLLISDCTSSILGNSSWGSLFRRI